MTTTEEETETISPFFYFLGKVLFWVYISTNIYIALNIWNQESGINKGEAVKDMLFGMGMILAVVFVFIAIIIILLLVTEKFVIPTIPESLKEKYDQFPAKDDLVGGGMVAGFFSIMWSLIDNRLYGIPLIAVTLMIYLYWADKKIVATKERQLFPDYREELVKLYNRVWELQSKSKVGSVEEINEITKIVEKMRETGQISLST